jgi:hypothetical protein
LVSKSFSETVPRHDRQTMTDSERIYSDLHRHYTFVYENGDGGRDERKNKNGSVNDDDDDDEKPTDGNRLSDNMKHLTLNEAKNGVFTEDNCTIKTLRDYAKRTGVKIPSNVRKKAEIIEFLRQTG